MKLFCMCLIPILVILRLVWECWRKSKEEADSKGEGYRIHYPSNPSSAPKWEPRRKATDVDFRDYWVYIVRWDHPTIEGKGFIKVGITTKTVEFRVETQEKGTAYKPTILYTRSFPTRKGMHKAEQACLKERKYSTGYVSKSVFQDGYTETFPLSKEDLLIKIVSNQED